MGSMEQNPRKPDDNRNRARGVKEALQRPESDKDGICSGCGKRGKKASAGARQANRHMVHCGVRAKVGGKCTGCKIEGKALQHTRQCGYHL